MKRTEYQKYLASREWAVLREAVRKRCNNVCERCNMNPMQSTHHLTYERKGKELLEDLQGLCEDCHKYLSGKSDGDPVEILGQAYQIPQCGLPNQAFLTLDEWHNRTCAYMTWQERMDIDHDSFNEIEAFFDAVWPTTIWVADNYRIMLVLDQEAIYRIFVIRMQRNAGLLSAALLSGFNNSVKPIKGLEDFHYKTVTC